MSEPQPGQASVVGRLLQEISWERATHYRIGGRGRENVLTAEVLMALDFLPRMHFLGAVIGAAQGAEQARAVLISDIEIASVSFLPGDLPLTPGKKSRNQRHVQPDALVMSTRSFVLVEAKRIRSNSFQPAQLAREYVAAMAHAENRLPIVLLLGVKPDVLVSGRGRMTIKEAVLGELVSVVEESGNSQLDVERLQSQIDDVFCWIPWEKVDEVVRTQEAAFTSSDPSITASVRRLAGSINDAIAWHA
ncbi:hypothetical protein [Arthrobacter sp.]|uniref:hypothetical protein n=1 Tax=Arthrobacter sp. TaxID=1667 RepID=UPI0026DFE108|nr:hypothetical protein [Arthrobacter sp.]MDO5753865.1 hypothetical protein [Arthrobacter sp.]